MIVHETGGSYEKLPTGMQPAVCTRVFDLGMQPGYEGKPQHKLIIMFELAERKTEGEFAGKRFLASRSYTASLNEKANLRKDLESWRGRPFTTDELTGFDLDAVVGINCNLNMVEVSKGEKTYVNIAAIVPTIKGQEHLECETPADYTPEWIQRMLGTVNDGYTSTTMDGPPADDTIPF